MLDFKSTEVALNHLRESIKCSTSELKVAPVGLDSGTLVGTEQRLSALGPLVVRCHPGVCQTQNMTSYQL